MPFFLLIMNYLKSSDKMFTSKTEQRKHNQWVVSGSVTRQTWGSVSVVLRGGRAENAGWESQICWVIQDLPNCHLLFFFFFCLFCVTLHISLTGTVEAMQVWNEATLNLSLNCLSCLESNRPRAVGFTCMSRFLYLWGRKKQKMSKTESSLIKVFQRNKDNNLSMRVCMGVCRVQGNTVKWCLSV